MLKGKIISISAIGFGRFKLIIDNHVKTFPNHEEMTAFLIKALEKSKDIRKKALLKQDLSNYLHKI